jgi:hypothetical protein
MRALHQRISAVPSPCMLRLVRGAAPLRRALRVHASAKDPLEPPKQEKETPLHLQRSLSLLRGSYLTRLDTYRQRFMNQTLGGTLVVDDVDHRGLVQAAAKEGNLSFGFSAGGCLFPYFIGVVTALLDAGLVTGALFTSKLEFP